MRGCSLEAHWSSFLLFMSLDGTWNEMGLTFFLTCFLSFFFSSKISFNNAMKGLFVLCLLASIAFGRHFPEFSSPVHPEDAAWVASEEQPTKQPVLRYHLALKHTVAQLSQLKQVRPPKLTPKQTNKQTTKRKKKGSTSPHCTISSLRPFPTLHPPNTVSMQPRSVLRFHVHKKLTSLLLSSSLLFSSPFVVASG